MSTSPSVSPVTEKVTRTRTISSSELAKESSGSMPAFWEYIETIRPEQWTDYIVYLYRDEPKVATYPGAPPAYLDKFPGTIEIRPGTFVPMDDAGNIQAAIKEKFGGKVFRLILKKGRERITETRFTTEAPPKFPDTNPQFAQQNQINTNGNHQPSDANSIASKAIDAVTGQQPEALKLAMEVLRAASDIVMRTAAPNGTPTASSLIDQTLIQALIAKALAPPPPPPDPFEMFVRFKEIMTPPAPANGVKETLDLITSLKSANLIGGSSGHSTLLDLGREVLPTIATAGRDAIHEWRLGVEAQARAMEVSRMNPQTSPPGGVPAVPPEIQAPPAVPPEPAPPAVPQPQAQVASGEPPFDWLAIKIVEILREQSYTIDEAVDETLSFLYRSHAPIVAQLLDPPKLSPQLPPGDKGLLMLFQHHPILKQIPVNPRLAEFIHKFIAAAKEAEIERMPGAVPAVAPVPPPPPA